MCSVISYAVQTLGTRDSPASSDPNSPATASSPATANSPAGSCSPGRCASPAPSTISSFIWPGVSSMSYVRWPQLMERIGRNLSVDIDILRQHHTCELYSSGLDKMAEEVRVSVWEHGYHLVFIHLSTQNNAFA